MPVKISVITPTIRGKAALVAPRTGLEIQSFKSFEWIVDNHKPEDGSNLNWSLNEMIRQADGELIVFLQDYIKPNYRGLEMFWEAYKTYDNTVFTAPVGRTIDFKDIDWDWRLHKDEKLSFSEWEIDWAAAPKKLLIECGGFDEALDKYWGFDNVNIGLRLNMNNVNMRNLKDNKAVAYDHNKIFKHPFQSLRNPEFHNDRLEQIRHGLKINFLKTS